MIEDKPTLLETARSVLRSYMTDAGRTAAKNLSWLAIYHILAQIAALASVFLLSNGLESDDFGVLTYALAVQSYLFILGSAGIRRVVIREVAGRPERADTVVTSHLAISGTASLVAFLATLAIVQFAPIEVNERILLTLLALGNVAACLNIRSVFDAHHRQPTSAAITLVTELAALLAIVYLVQIDMLTLPYVGGVFAAKWTFASAAHFLLYHTSIRPLRLVFSAENVREMLSSSWSLVLSGLVARTPLTSGIFFVRAFHSEHTAILGLAQQVARGYSMFTTIGNRILLPHIAGPYGLHKGFIKKMILFLILFRGLLLLAAFGVAAVLVVELLDPVYRQALVPMAILLVARLIGGVSGISTMYAIVLHREPVVLLANVCACGVFVIGCLALVPQYSYYAVAGVAVCAAAVRVVLVVRSVRSAHSEASR